MKKGRRGGVLRQTSAGELAWGGVRREGDGGGVDAAGADIGGELVRGRVEVGVGVG